jgi:hypothetical protein
MNKTTEEVCNILIRTRKVQTTNGCRLTIRRQTEDGIGYIEVFIWESDMPNEADFVSTTVVEGGFDMASVVKAVKSIPTSSIVASLDVTEERRYRLTSSRPLTELMKQTSGVCIQELWTQGITWRLFHGIIPAKVPQAWLSLTSITLDLITDTLEDQLQCRETLLKGELRKFLSQLRMLRHLNLNFYSELLEDDDMIWSHAPLEYALDTRTKWPHLKSVQIDGFNSTTQELLYFLESYCSTLKALTLRNYFLLSGSWLQTLPAMREFLSLETAEIAGAMKANNELWLIKVPEFDENCFLAEDLSYWLTHPTIELACPLTRTNLVKTSSPQEEDWE